MEKDENKNMQLKTQETKEVSGALQFFSDNSHFVFILKKAEKLSSAIYLITGFFDDQEPLKWKLRNLSNKLLSSSLEIKDTLNSSKEKGVLDIEAIVLEITSLLIVAKNAGLISEMNFDIINKEFDGFANSLTFESEALVKEGGAQFKKDYFKVEEYVPPKKIEHLEPIKVPEAIAPEPKETVLEAPSVYEPKFDTLENVSKNIEPLKTDNKSQKIDEGFLARMGQSRQPREIKPLKEFGAVAVKKNSRQSIIISLLKRKKEIMIKDVSPLIEGCSEKTIQRELLSMVQRGILKKQGEKRWSRYSLA